jgi:phosphatidate cytidylyltransferase
VLLIGPPTAHVLALRWLPNGFEWTLLILAAVWLNDSSAYVTGRWMGSHPMAPTLSPNKTWEGALAAAAVSTAGTLVAATPLGIPLPAAAVLSAQVAVLAPIGDLTVSYLKRQAGLKDSGQTIPGHGGILDRVDSLMFAVMGAYYVALLTQQ